MFLKILKKDLKRKKVINVILLVLIILSALFMAAGVGSLKTITGSLDYFAKLTNRSDYVLIYGNDDGLDDFLRSSELVKGYEYRKYIYTIKCFTNASGENLDMGACLLAIPNKTYDLILDSENEPIYELNEGEISVPYEQAVKYGLKTGDWLTLSIGDYSKTFTIKYICKDMLFGSSYMGYKRIGVCQSDYNELLQAGIGKEIPCYFIASDDTNALIKSMNKNGFRDGYGIDSGLIKICYMVIKLIGAALAAASIIFIVIAFVVLRFTISFTIQEDYREIGVMKAMGVPDGGIRRLYITKYTAAAIIGALVGIALSFPAEKLAVSYLGASIPTPSTSSNSILHILCGLAVILLTISFCWHCTGKLKKQTAMQAIRSGESGERYGRKSILTLNKSKAATTPLLMAVNDICSDFKRYLSLLLIFILSTILVILPLNIANTLSSADTMVDMFGFIRGDVFVDCKNDAGWRSFEEMDNKIATLEALYAENGVDVDLIPINFYIANIYINDVNNCIKVTCRQPRAYSSSELSVLDGSAPRLENEILVTRQIMDELGVKVGDTVKIQINGKEMKFIISGRYQCISDQGMMIWLSDKLNLPFDGSWATFTGFLKDKKDIESTTEKMRLAKPNISVMDSQTFAMSIIGTASKQIDALKIFLLILVLSVNGLIAVLMAKTFITKDTGEIALLKSLGFTDRRLRLWQMLRISLVMLVAVIIGLILSQLIDGPFFSFIFGMMGATDVEVVIKPLEIYILYPALLLVGTALAAFLATTCIRRISFREINNIEQEKQDE